MTVPLRRQDEAEQCANHPDVAALGQFDGLAHDRLGLARQECLTGHGGPVSATRGATIWVAGLASLERLAPWATPLCCIRPCFFSVLAHSLPQVLAVPGTALPAVDSAFVLGFVTLTVSSACLGNSYVNVVCHTVGPMMAPRLRLLIALEGVRGRSARSDDVRPLSMKSDATVLDVFRHLSPLTWL